MRITRLPAALLAAFMLVACQSGGSSTTPTTSSAAADLQPGTYTGVWESQSVSEGRARSRLEIEQVTADRVVGVYNCTNCGGSPSFTLPFDVPRRGNAFTVPTRSRPLNFEIRGSGSIRGRFGEWVINYS